MWFAFVKIFAAVFFGSLAAIFGLILLIDPYDSGRFAGGWISGIVDENPRTANASRGRDLNFDSAVLGNSHGQLLSPSRLAALTNRKFVQLTVPGTGPQEQLALLHWFTRHHARIGAVVLVTDSTWCTQDASLPMSNPFPFWLYADSGLEYAANVLRPATLNRVLRRILLAFGLRQATDPAGYWDYEKDRVWSFAPTVPPGLQVATESREPHRPFPAVERLAAVLAEQSARVPFVVVYPPAFVTALPEAGSANAEMLAECKGALDIAVRGRGAFLDLAADDEMAREPKNYMDATHYRSPVAMRVESRIAEALERMNR